VVNLPLSLAQQIHYYLVESQLSLLEQQQKQMEQMIQEGTLSNLAQAVAHFTFIREVLGSNLGWDTNFIFPMVFLIPSR
jgi:hypothetical protein